MSFTCETCQKSFSQKCSLNRHIKTVHDKIKDFECQICIKRFSTKTDLTRHIKTVHDKVRDFECHICNKTYSQKYNLENHIKIVHNKVKNFECNICHKKFSRKSDLQSHMNLIHINPKDNRMSRPEMNVKAVLELLELNYVNECKFDGLLGLGQRQLRFDFGLQTSDKWLLIEYDGIQHCKPVCFGSMTIKEAIEALKVCQAHDRLKNDFCLLNGFPLLRLTAQNLPDLKDIVSDFVKSHSNLLDKSN